MKSKPAATVTDVQTFLDELDHPLKREIVAVRKAILKTDKRISEGIKWNAPSFRTGEYFATVNLRSTDTVQLILHLGAKARKDVKAQLAIEDPEGLLKWLAKDRAMATLGAGKEFTSNSKAFVKIIKQWIEHVQ
jgi:Domain of unknown function (DU1801)